MSIKPVDLAEFGRLLTICQELGEAFPDGLVYIGGIAVYLHTVNSELTRHLAETTHDADFYISIADMADLRDLEEVTPNRRLFKHQLIKGGFEFDIYTERHSALIVPYDQVVARAVSYETLKVASVEHLLVLKLEAYRQRRASSKGRKDAKDLIRIVLVSEKNRVDSSVLDAYLSDDHRALLQDIARGPEFLSLAQGNAKQAKDYRQKFVECLKRWG
jgi:hypothetical protein